ncbi:MAG: hypothetical protein EPN36_14345 [Rhodanobacteraceae bacterium]|nr:MAG: hypothetical protein EPN36_14345 [Rhodanobacteraceae bacterium]
MERLTKDPNGPQMARLDLLIDKEHRAMLEDILDSANIRRREGIHLAIKRLYDEMKAEGKITED